MTDKNDLDTKSFQSIVEHFRAKKINQEEAKALLENLKKRGAQSFSPPLPKESFSTDPIAVVGMAGRFPDAKDVETLWENLATGHNALGRLPKKYLESPLTNGNAYEWGGIIADRDCFDPLFFSITPREARSMSPHQRMILEESWKALEDAGYNPRTLAGSNLGVFIGAEPTGYYFESFTGYSDAIIATRLSYFLNLHGPAMVVNTGCSSSAVAIHLACESLRNRESDMALAGGVFGLMDQASLMMMAKVGMLSPSGRCRTFDAASDGTVISEGVGMVALKRLEDAVSHNDPIHGVICGSGVNQDGASNGITAPSGIAQTLLISGVYTRFHIRPQEISLVEAHGTGTRLGDPVEGNALVQTFKRFTDKKGFCAVGSAKSHIGHTGAAAGVASLIKVLLSIKHKKIPGLINFDTLNPLIEFENSPFYVNTRTRNWEKKGDLPRTAAINSFGHSGTNVHLVVRQYLPREEKKIPQPLSIRTHTPYLIPLSAKTKECLQAQARNLLAFLKKPSRKTGDTKEFTFLAKVAHTLQTGREPMAQRMIFFALNLDHLVETLEKVCTGENPVENVWISKEIRARQTQDFLPPDTPLSLDGFKKIAALWAGGQSLDFNRVFPGPKPGRISLPTYPFARERYWIPDPVTRTQAKAHKPFAPFIHPLVQQNTSTLKGLQFSSVFTGTEFFLADHRIQGKSVLPGMAYLEMAREAVQLAAGPQYNPASGITLKNIVWQQPVLIENAPVQVHIRLTQDLPDQTGFEIYTLLESADPTGRVHSRGIAVSETQDKIPALDIPALMAACDQGSVSNKDCYEFFRAMGVEYGPAHRAIDTLFLGSGQVLAKLSLSREIFGKGEPYILHPGMMDAVIQSSMGLAPGHPLTEQDGFVLKSGLKPALPFALDTICILRPCQKEMWAWIRPGKKNTRPEKIQKLDMDLYDTNGVPIAWIRGFSTRPLIEKSGQKPDARETSGLVLLEPVWEAPKDIPSLDIPDFTAHWVFFCDPPPVFFAPLESQIEGASVKILTPKGLTPAEKFTSLALDLFDRIKQMLKGKPPGNILVQAIVFSQAEDRLFSGLSALLKTAGLENPKFFGQVIEMNPVTDNATLIDILCDNKRTPRNAMVRYQDTRRQVQTLREITFFSRAPLIPWKDKGVYLITGGLGGLGLLFVSEIALRARNTRIILTGRSPLDAQVQTRLDTLSQNDARIEYHSVDISDTAGVSELIGHILEKFSALDGILHSAGVIRDNFIIKKQASDMEQVLMPKVTGLAVLDLATKDLDLDFFILFSSIAGFSGSSGQADYAAANGFMNAYAGYREHLRQDQRRRGRTIAINWPLWKQGGMGIDPTAQRIMTQMTGMSAMDTQTGMDAFYQSLAQDNDSILVMAGNLPKIRQFVALSAPDTPEKTQPPPGRITREALLKRVLDVLAEIAAKALDVPAPDLEFDAHFTDFGFDPLMFSRLITEMNARFCLDLSMDLYSQYPGLYRLARYVCDCHEDLLLAHFNASLSPSPVQKEMIREKGVEEQALAFIKTRIALAIDIPLERLDPDTAMEAYGIDSIMAMELTLELEKTFGSLPKTLFFEYLDIRELTGYFLGHYPERLGQILTPDRIARAATPPSIQPDETPARALPPQSPPEISDIAIIGLAGRYAKSNTLQEFWQNLASGTDCITPIPQDRWDHFLFSHTNWGGFLTDADKFDPLFFNISPQEAVFRDPQERLFLECVQETLEDAGYTKGSLQHAKGTGPIGVYVGVMYEEYQLYGAQEQAMGRFRVLSGSQASIANRISYFYDFNGPSMAVDTMCSSSLSAIHLACQSIRQKECALAVAGGVNLSVHPNKFLMLDQGKLASSDGRCRSFGKGGDGYVPGEGVGAVLLKPLSQAIEDQDHIYGIIRGSALNHGGKTNGYSVPNPKAQAAVISQAFSAANVHPRTISFLEAHGTGTFLGDPIEIAGLTRAFREQTMEKQFCAIGSAKSNIGHCEGAAGIAGLTKVLLQMKHGLLVPSLHSKTVNPNIDFENSPFRVQQEPEPWKRPVIHLDGHTREYPRIAGISSFGAGGGNAHVIVEEYVSQHQDSPVHLSENNPAVILVSAKNDPALIRQAMRLKDFIFAQALTDADLKNLAFTLQKGREHYSHRLAFTAGSMAAVAECLTAFAGNPLPGELAGNLFTGRVPRKNAAIRLMEEDDDMAGTVGVWILKKKYDRVLSLWVQGLFVDWDLLYPKERPRRISLPAYAFEKNRYWISEKGFQPDSRGSMGIKPALHPLVHENTSNFHCQKFTSVFTGKESFLADHQISGSPVLPGTACLEMAREAVCRAMGSQGPLCLKNLAWIRPVRVAQTPVTLHTRLFLETDGQIRFEICSLNTENQDNKDQDLVLHCTGQAMSLHPGKIYFPDLTTLQTQCNRGQIASKHCYEVFFRMGMAHGPSFQGIDTLYLGKDELLAKLVLPVSDNTPLFFLDPGILDSAFQSATGLAMNPAMNTDRNGSAPDAFGLPFAMDSLEIFNKTQGSMWARVRYQDPGRGKLRKLDIDLVNETGQVCVRMKGFSTRPFRSTPEPLPVPLPPRPPGVKTLVFVPAWEKRPAHSENTSPGFSRHLVILWDRDVLPDPDFPGRFPMEILGLKPEKPGLDACYMSFSLAVFERIKAIIAEKQPGKTLIQVVIPSTAKHRVFTGISGLLKTAAIENPLITGQVIEILPTSGKDDLVLKLKENAACPQDSHIRYQEGQRQVSCWQKTAPLSSSGDLVFRDHATYLITGGAGGLGLIFAKEILSRAPRAVLILTGRSDLSKNKKDQLKTLVSRGATIRYAKADVSDQKSVNTLVQKICAKFKTIEGILHSAGIIADNFILKKSAREFARVMAPKVGGVCCLDRATRHLPLEFFVFFSSGSGAMGNMGQADYAAANAFMDAFARFRNLQKAKGNRQGKTLSINWPLWEQGQMQMADETRHRMTHHTGAIPLKTASGIAAFYQGMALGQDQVLVLEGEPKKLEALVTGRSDKNFLPPPQATRPLHQERADRMDRNSDLLTHPDALIIFLKQRLSLVIQLPADQIETDVPFDEYGMDSIMVMNFISLLEAQFGFLSKTLVFEYENIQDLARYFMEFHGTRTNTLVQTTIETTAEPLAQIQVHAQPLPDIFRVPAEPEASQTHPDTDIAVIGMSGQYPESPDLEVFWDNLKSGRDCITKIPKDRWDNDLYFDPNKNRLGKIYTQWGGFLKNVDQFDPLFFDIPEREAEWTDPKERLFLETVWNLFERSGHTRKKLDETYKGKVGVWVGSMYQQYHFAAPDAVKQSVLSVLASHSYIANRISYFYNFQGPSMAIDTKCSSSLTAVHLACESLIKGECRLAVAGGVNLTLHPHKYLGMCNLNLIASDPDIRSFGNGDGFIPAEGVGAVLLKPLADAIQDKDAILAVIKSSLINHGGQTQGFTNPDPKSHLRLIADNLKKSCIDPRTITYVESSAIGSAPNDLIEISALGKAFRHYTRDLQFCAIGSVKSFMGHAEAAAGISQLTKVILQLQHGKLVPTIKATPLNPDLRFESTPFFLPHTLSDWENPVIRVNGENKTLPRRAAINCFGVGGSNAHLILEEYMPDTRDFQKAFPEPTGPEILVFSAPNQERLTAVLSRMLEFVKAKKNLALPDMAHTLRTGRETMACRAAMVVHNRETLIPVLEALIQGKGRLTDSSISSVFTGEDKKSDQIKARFSGKTGQAADFITTDGKSFEQIAQAWAQGSTIAWEQLYPGQNRRIIGLPTYPFAKKRYWITPDNGPGEKTPPYAPDPEKSLLENITLYLKTAISREFKKPISKIHGNSGCWTLRSDLGFCLKLMRLIEEQLFLKITEQEMQENNTIDALADLLAHKTDPGAKTGYAPLSEGQKGLWLLQKRDPSMSAYNLPVAYRLHPALDTDLFLRACAFTSKAHPILNTRIAEERGLPCQKSFPEQPVYFKQWQIGHLSEDDLLAFIKGKAREPFSLDKGPLVKYHLFCAPGRDPILLIVIHHIILDGVSLILLLKTLWNAYAEYKNLKTPVETAGTTQYTDFVRWEQQMLESPEGLQHLDYWKKNLAGTLPVLSLPVDFTGDFPGQLPENTKGEVYEFCIDPGFTRKLMAFSRSRRINPSILFLGVFKVLLYRYTGQTDIIVGMPTMGRPEPRFESIIGYFVNMVAFRSSLSGDTLFIDFLTRLRSTMFEGLAHAVFPFPALVRELKLPRHARVSPIFQVAYTYQNFLQLSGHKTPDTPWLDNRDTPLSMESLEGLHQEGDNDFGLEIIEGETHFQVAMEYHPGRFKLSTIQQMMGHYIALLEAVIVNPDRTVSQLPMLDPTQTQSLVSAGTGRQTYNEPLPIHEQIWHQAGKTPRAAAVEFGGTVSEHLTYAQLQEASHDIFNALISRKILPGDRIALCLYRCVKIIPAMLAIFRAGAVYVPIDPDVPEKRICHILEDTTACLVLTHDRTLGKLTALREKFCLAENTLECLNLDRLEKPGSALKNPEIPPLLSLDAPAYIIYTSGSTGTPKGVVVSHRALANHCAAARDTYAIAPEDTLLQFASLGVDTSLEQILPGLSVGAKIWVKDENLWSPKHFSQNLASHNITIIDVPPVYLQELLVYWRLFPEFCPDKQLKLAIVGGEEILSETIALWLESPMEKTRLINAYGPTETTITSTIFQIDAAACKLSRSGRIPLGRALGNRIALVLDQDDNLVPPGVPGQLHIGGDIATGYLNLVHQTQENFIPNPFADNFLPNISRLYRTGDLARVIPGTNGLIEFLGRMDHQINIRGFRIEPGEIETHLAAHETVAQSLVLAHGPDKQDPQLVAYVVGKNADPDPKALKAFLKDKLPGHMIPAAFVILDQFPLLPGGKVDRMALPDPGRRTDTGKKNFIAPKDDMETTLTQIWCKVLGLSRVGVCDDFFDLGGHSILLVRLAAEIGQALGAEVSIAALISHPSIQQQARMIRGKHGEHSENTQELAVVMQPHGSLPPFFCIHPSGGNILCYRALARLMGENRPFYGIQSPGISGKAVPPTLEEMAAVYADAIRKIQPQGPYYIGGWSLGGVVAYELAVQLRKAEEKIACLALIESSTPEATRFLEALYLHQDKLADADREWLMIKAFVQDLNGSFDPGVRDALDRKIQDLSCGNIPKTDNLFNRVMQSLVQDVSASDSDLLNRLFCVFRSNIQAMDSYLPRPLDIPVCLIRARGNKDRQANEASANGWERLIGKNLRITMVPGDHYTILKEPDAIHLAKTLNQLFATGSSVVDDDPFRTGEPEK